MDRKKSTMVAPQPSQAESALERLAGDHRDADTESGKFQCDTGETYRSSCLFPAPRALLRSTSGFECKRLSLNEKAETLLVLETAHDGSLRQMPGIKETAGPFQNARSSH